MKELTADYWQARYENGDTGWDAGSITEPIKAYFAQISDKNAKILIAGAGNAHEAIYLYQNGFKNIYVCDWAAAPLAYISAALPDFPKNQLLQADFFALDMPNFFDFAVEQTFFCALPPALRPDYAQKMQNLLKKEGKIVGLMFDFPLNLQGEPPFGGDKSEYIGYFSPYFANIDLTPCYNSIKPRAGKELWANISGIN